jgi:hypothetical protein
MPGSKNSWQSWSQRRGYDHHALAECGDPEVAEDFLPIVDLVLSSSRLLELEILAHAHHGELIDRRMDLI